MNLVEDILVFVYKVLDSRVFQLLVFLFLLLNIIVLWMDPEIYNNVKIIFNYAKNIL